MTDMTDMTDMAAPDVAGAVIYAKDVGRVSRFYEAVMGFDVALVNPSYTVLASTTYQLVVVAVPAEVAEKIELSTPPVRREDTPIKLVFTVPGLDELRQVAVEFEGRLNSAEQEWAFLGYRVCDGHDPEGNVIQLRCRKGAG